MTTYYGSPLTVFRARTSFGALVSNDAPWIRPLAAMKFPWSPVTLATLNFATMGDRAWTCPTCTYQDPCFLCSDDLRWWLEDGNLQARRRMGVHPMPLSEMLCLCEGTGHWEGTAGMAAWNANVEASAEPFDVSDVHELVAFYGQSNQVRRRDRGEDEEDIMTVDTCPNSEAGSSSSLDDNPHNTYMRPSRVTSADPDDSYDHYCLCTS